MHATAPPRSFVSFALLLTLAFALSACEQIQEFMQQAQEEAATTQPEVPPPPPGQAESNELNGYVDCYNRAVPRANESIDRYFSHVPKEEGPDCDKHKGDLYTLYEDSVQICNEAAQKGASSGPNWSTLEASAKEIAAANAVLVPLVQKVADNWEQEDYKDDACAGAKSLHGEFVAAAERFQSAEAAFSEALDNIKEVEDRNALKRLEKAYGKNYEWHTRAMTIEAKKLLVLVPQGPETPFDKEAYTAQSAEVENAYNALQSYADKNQAEIQKNVFIGAGVESDAKEFYTASKLLRRELEAEEQDGSALAEKVNKLIDEYNDLIQATNRMTFRYQQ